MSNRVIEAELIIKGSDKTGGAFAGVIRHAEQLQKMLGGIKGIKINDANFSRANAEIRKQTRLLRTERLAAHEINRAFTAGNEALERRAGLISRISGKMREVAHVGGMGWMVGGIASGRATHTIAHDTADYSHQLALLRSTSGMKAQEISRAIDQAWRVNVPGLSAADNLKAIGELRMVFGSTEHAIAHLRAIQRATAMMAALNPHMNAENESYGLARALELKGVSNNPAHFARLLNLMVQSINASRGKITGTDFAEFTQYSRAAATHLSDQFYSRIAPTLIQEMHGSSAGRAVSDFRRAIVGGKMTNKAAEEFARLDLVTAGSVIKTKTGSVKGIRPGGILGSELADRDPYEWVQKYLRPALEKHGIKKPERVSAELAHLFSNTYSEQFANILLTQVQRIEKDRNLANEAPGVEALKTLRGTDPFFALTDLAGGIKNLSAALGSPLAGYAIKGINMLSDGVKDFAEEYAAMSRATPWLATGVSGAGAAGLGFVGLKGAQAVWGLATAGTQLQASAAALDAAAARLGATSMTNTAPLANTAVTTAALSRWGIAARWLPLWLGGAYSIATTPDILTRSPTGKSWDEVLREHGINAGAEHLTPENAKPFKIEDIRAALGGVKAELSGEAKITTHVEVKTEPGFWATVKSSISNAISHVHLNGADTGTTGSVGETMPEAAAGR